LKYAKVIADHFKTDHTEFIVTPKAVDIIDDLIDAFDEPYADPSQIPMYYLSKMTREHVTVALNGDGGDESFGGYERYLGMLMQEKYRKLPLALRREIYKLIKNFPENSAQRSFIRRFKWLNKISLSERSQAYLSVYRSFDEELKGRLYTEEMKAIIAKGEGDSEFLSCFDSKYAYKLIDKMLYTDISTYLPQDLLVKSDRSTMYHSLEGRSPLLDYKLMEYTATLPGEMKIKGHKLKYLLKKLSEKYIPKKIINRQKQGFGVPLGSWFKNELKDHCQDIFNNSVLVENGLLQKSEMGDFLTEHIAGKKNHGRKLFAILMLEQWYRKA